MKQEKSENSNVKIDVGVCLGPLLFQTCVLYVHSVVMNLVFLGKYGTKFVTKYVALCTIWSKISTCVLYFYAFVLPYL